MSFAASLLPEFDVETANTRRVLACVPDHLRDWRAHPRCNTIGWNADHLVEIPDWVEGTLTSTEWDFSPPGEPPYQMPSYPTQAARLAAFDGAVARARNAIQNTTDDVMDGQWSLLCQGEVLFKQPRRDVLRTFALNHLIHHRAHLCAYLRMNDIPVPGLYGPSGFE